MGTLKLRKAGAESATVEATKPLSAFDIGAQMASAGGVMLAVALQVVALLGDSVYSPKDGLPKWGKLPKALKDADHKVSRNEFALGMASYWDNLYVNGALAEENTQLGQRQRTYRAMLKRAGVRDATMFTSLTPAAKAKLSEESDARKDAVQAVKDLLNGFYSDQWSAMKSAEDKYMGRKRTRDTTQRSLMERLCRMPLENLPKAVAKAVDEDGYDVHPDMKEICRLILKNRWAKVEASEE